MFSNQAIGGALNRIELPPKPWLGYKQTLILLAIAAVGAALFLPY
jgi:hypothetical protein